MLSHALRGRSCQAQAWIVKPAASAQGKGIFVTTFSAGSAGGGPVSKALHGGVSGPSGPSGPKARDMTSAVVSQYVSNPYLLNGCKFDLRLYVAVTSMNPLRIFLHEVTAACV